MFAVFSKEFKAYFYSALGYVFMGVFLLIGGIFFANYNLIPASPLYSNVLSSMQFIFLLLVPVTTMKLLAEEKHQKTDQLLLTSPLSLWEIVIGKYLASVALFFTTLLITLLYPLILSSFGKLHVGEIAATYIGFALMGSAFLAIGLYVSSLTENQVVSAVVCFGALIFIWIIDWIQQNLPSDTITGAIFAALLVVGASIMLYRSTKSRIVSIAQMILGAAAIIAFYIKKPVLFEGFMPNFLGWFSLTKRFQSFSMGVLDLSSVIYYISFCIAFVYLTTAVLRKKRWS